MTNRRTRTIAASIAALTAIDLASKFWAVRELSDRSVRLPGPVDLQLHYNSGVAFGFLSAVPAIVISAITVAVGVALVNMWRTARAPSVPVALILGGALANTADRLEGGSVVDMLHTGWWPTFNIADTFITTGVAAWMMIATTSATQAPKA